MSQKAVGAVSRQQRTTLVMLSGGIDSTAALWHVLHHPKEFGQVHIHHIHIQNIETRWRAEAIAVQNILRYLRKHAPSSFTYTDSVINTPQLVGRFLFDTEIISFITGYMTSRDPRITKVVIGATGTDFAMTASESVKRGKAIHNAFHTEVGDHSAAVKVYPHSHLTKAEVYKTLPKELAALTWSCRTPRYADGKALECGKCKTCSVELAGMPRPKTAGKRLAKERN